MGRKQKRNMISTFWIVYAGIVIFLSLLNETIYWLTSLPKVTWLILLAVTAGILFAWGYIRKRRKIREEENRKLALRRQGHLSNLKQMDPFEFERYICDLFKELGYEANVTTSSGDGGKDLIMTRGRITAVAECKRYVTTKITRPQIQKFHSAVIDSNAEKGHFITTSDFTKHAITYVENKPIILINGETLVKMIEEATKEGKTKLHKAIEGYPPTLGH